MMYRTQSKKKKKIHKFISFWKNWEEFLFSETESKKKKKKKKKNSAGKKKVCMKKKKLKFFWKIQNLLPLITKNE